MVDVADDIEHSPGAGEAGRNAIASGAPIICDCGMVAAGIIRRRLHAENRIIVMLDTPGVAERAAATGDTRSAAAAELWQPWIEDSVVAIGAAPTALFRLLELIDRGWPKPAIVLGFPVGFVGASESKSELSENPRGAQFISLRGRRGGSAMASAAVNALAAGLPEEAERRTELRDRAE